MTTDIDALELEGAELAAAVAVQVMGWSCPQGSRLWYERGGQVGTAVNCWRPDRDIAQAFQVMRVNPNWRWGITEGYKSRSVLCYLTGIDGVTLVWLVVAVIDGDWHRAWCTAICRAAVKAVRPRP